MATVAREMRARSAEIAYRRILVPVDFAPSAALTIACALAAEHGACVDALAVIEVPSALPLDAEMPEDAARERLALAEAIGDRYGVRVERNLVRARLEPEAIVAAADEADVDLIVLRRRLDKTARHVLKHARSRVLLSSPAP